jgi:hypothetical protein
MREKFFVRETFAALAYFPLMANSTVAAVYDRRRFGFRR